MESGSEVATHNTDAPFFDISKIIRVRETLKITETKFSQETIHEDGVQPETGARDI
jgi:hypothetical protein